MSHVDQLVFATTKASLVYDGTRFSVDFPWKCGRPSLPDNRDVAMQRLIHTEKQLTRNMTLLEKYDGIIRDYIRKGYVSEVLPSKHWPSHQ